MVLIKAPLKCLGKSRRRFISSIAKEDFMFLTELFTQYNFHYA